MIVVIGNIIIGVIAIGVSIFSVKCIMYEIERIINNKE